MADPQDVSDVVICVPPRRLLMQPRDPEHREYRESPDRVWTEKETQHLLDLFRKGKNVSEIAAALDVEERAAVVQLLRNLMNAQGRLDDELLAFRAGETYSREDQMRLRSMYADGHSLAEISQELGRSQLGAG